MPAAPTYLRHLLIARTEWMEERLYEKAAANGYGDITPAMSRLYAHLAGRPVPLAELGRRLAISRQAVHKMAQEGIQAGYVEMIPSEHHPRTKRLRFTDKGWDMAESATRELEAIEARLVAEIGAERLEQLKAVLAMPWSAEERAARPSPPPQNPSPQVD